LVHSDLSVVDSQGQVLSPRLTHYQGLLPHRDNFLDLLSRNCITGCTMLMTPALARIGTPIPDEVMMHDWWLALVASLCGRISFIDRSLVAYRQHDRNTVGAKPLQTASLLTKLYQLLCPEIDRLLRRRAQQAGHLLQRYPDRLSYYQKIACRLMYWQRFDSVSMRLVMVCGFKYLRWRAALRWRASAGA
jgi:transposase